MSTPDWFDKGRPHVWLPYAQMKSAPAPAPVKGTHGARIILSDGRELLDGVGSWWTSVHGYNHPHLVDAVRRQLEVMPHVMLGGLAHEQPYRLAFRLAKMLPGDLSRVFFSESGSVAVEVAMKIAIQHRLNTTGQVKPKFLSFRGGYHGDTMATMSICDPEEGMHALFAGALARQYIIDLPGEEASIAAMADVLEQNRDIAAVLVEPLIQAAGGMRIYDAATLRRIRQLCDQFGVLLIFDEIFTGFGRTGAMFAADVADVAPDIVTLGKALTGGVAPLAATVASERVYASFHSEDLNKALMHGPTFTGHALGCAAANASLDLFENENRLGQVASIAAQLKRDLSGLAGWPGVKEVRMLGAVGAVEMEQPFEVERWRSWFIEQGVFIRPLGRVIYLAPAFTIDSADLGRLTAAIAQAVKLMTG